jgi:hypothetical protein
MQVLRARRRCSDAIFCSLGYVIANPSCIFRDTLLAINFLRIPKP